MSDKQSVRQKFRANITASGSTGVQGGTEYPVHGEAQVRVQTSGFGGTNVVEIQVKIFDGSWSTLDSVTGNADSGALDVSAWDFVRFNVTTADGTGTIVASGFFSKAQSAGGGASAAFTIVQADSGTSPTATGATDTLTVTGTGGIATSGDATTDTITINLNINSLTEDATPDSAADYIITLDASTGTNKKVLLDNLNLSATPAGSDGYMQYNNGGAFGATSLYYDDVNGRYSTLSASPTYFFELGDGTSRSDLALHLERSSGNYVRISCTSTEHSIRSLQGFSTLANSFITNIIGVSGGTRVNYMTSTGISYFNAASVPANNRFYIKGVGTSSTTISFHVVNSAATSLMLVRDNGIVNMPNLPTSSAGLSAGDLWNNSGVINIV